MRNFKTQLKSGDWIRKKGTTTVYLFTLYAADGDYSSDFGILGLRSGKFKSYPDEIIKKDIYKLNENWEKCNHLKKEIIKE